MEKKERAINEIRCAEGCGRGNFNVMSWVSLVEEVENE